MVDNYTIKQMREILWSSYELAEQRCLRKACECVADLESTLPRETDEDIMPDCDNHCETLFDAQYEHAKTCFELQEYERAAYKLRNPKLDRMYHLKRFLHYFSLYKAAEKKRIDLMNEVSVIIPKKAMLKFNELRDSLERSITHKEADGWLLYVYGLVLYKFRLQQRSVLVLEEAIKREPKNWSAWYMLATIIDDEKQLHCLNLPKHLFKSFFNYLVAIELDLTESSLKNYMTKDSKTLDEYFSNSLFVSTLLARSLSQTGDRKDLAVALFSQIRQTDPYLVDAMDIYSNALYVRRKRKDLAKLAYDMEKIDPFTPEANSCIANSYSAREQHTKAIVYFTRALRLNPDHLNSWTLIGHEYLEVKSFDKALQAYRFAIFINKRDRRAWLGLGNTHETIMTNVQNPDYEPCVYYYSQVAKYRPNDQNMFLALGSVFDKLYWMKPAIYCFKRAGEEGAIMLEKLYETRLLRENPEFLNTVEPNLES